MKRKNSFKEYKPLTDKLVEIVDNSLLCQHWLVGLMKGEKDIKIKNITYFIMIKNILLFIVLLSSIFLISCTNSEIIKITIPPNKIIEAPIQENFNQGIIKIYKYPEFKIS